MPPTRAWEEAYLAEQVNDVQRRFFEAKPTGEPYDVTLEVGWNESRFWFPCPSINCYPIVLEPREVDDRFGTGRFSEEVESRISVL
jgi:hypothetical protein